MRVSSQPNPPTRRRFLGHALQGFLGYGLCRRALANRALANRALANPQQDGPAKRCVVLWMNGGPSQFETFDPKPGTATGGPTESIRTSVPGLRIAAGLPQIAQRMEQLCVLRNVTSEEGEHERAQYYLHTGFRLVPAFPRPALGSVVSYAFPESDLPKYVLLGGRGYGPAYCGPDHASFAIDSASTARELLGRVQERGPDLRLLQRLGAEFDRRNDFPEVRRRSAMVGRIERLITTPFRQALDLSSESPQTRARYGEHEFGERCLLARRLLEQGVPFVEVQLDGWDTHIDNFRSLQRLTATIDSAWAALLDDLTAAGLWEDTLLVWMGEFGRTPLINGQNGRDHYPAVTPVVLGGGGVQTGQAIGTTNTAGTRLVGEAVRVADVAATILSRLGIAPDTVFTTSFDSPTEATDQGRVIEGT